MIIVFLDLCKKKKEAFLNILKKNSRPYDGLCRILFLNDTETASKNMLEFFL